MPWGLRRFQETEQVHYITFSCHPQASEPGVRRGLRHVRGGAGASSPDYGLCIYGYVVMPEHVHLLMNEPERKSFAQAIKPLKQGVARRLALWAEDSFWQARYYDFKLGSETWDRPGQPP
jgi:putative transposase